MFMRSLFLFLFFLPGLAFSGATPAPIVEEIISVMESIPPCKTKEELVAHYHKLFEEKIRQVQDEMCKAVGIDRQQSLACWEEMSAKFNGALTTEDKVKVKKYVKGTSPSPRVLKITQEVLQEFGLDPLQIDVYATPLEQNGGIAAACYKRLLLVNDELVKRLSDHELRAIVAHEVQHIIFWGPDLATKALGPRMDYDGIQRAIKSCKVKWTLIDEMRADVLVALKSPYYALCMQHVFERMKYSIGCVSWLFGGASLGCDEDHPSIGQRIVIAKTVAKQLAQLPSSEMVDPRALSLARDMKAYRFSWWLRHEGRYYIPLYLQETGWGRYQATRLFYFLSQYRIPGYFLGKAASLVLKVQLMKISLLSQKAMAQHSKKA
jgi:hypothetical protein